MDKSNNEPKAFKKKASQTWGYLISELSFIFVPFLVMTIIFAYKMKLSQIFSEPEWSLASAVMFGQSIIKSYHGFSKASHPGRILHYNIAGMFSLIILFGLIPSLIILSIIYTAEYDLPLWVIILQIFLFILAVFVFSIINIISFEFEEKEVNRLRSPQKNE